MDDEFLHESKEEDQFIKEFDDSLSLGNQSLELVSDNLLEGNNNILISKFFLGFHKFFLQIQKWQLQTLLLLKSKKQERFVLLENVFLLNRRQLQVQLHHLVIAEPIGKRQIIFFVKSISRKFHFFKLHELLGCWFDDYSNNLSFSPRGMKRGRGRGRGGGLNGLNKHLLKNGVTNRRKSLESLDDNAMAKKFQQQIKNENSGINLYKCMHIFRRGL